MLICTLALHTSPTDFEGTHSTEHVVLIHGTAKFRKATALAKKLFLRRDILPWTCLYLTLDWPGGYAKYRPAEGWMSQFEIKLNENSLLVLSVMCFIS